MHKSLNSTAVSFYAFIMLFVPTSVISGNYEKGWIPKKWDEREISIENSSPNRIIHEAYWHMVGSTFTVFIWGDQEAIVTERNESDIVTSVKKYKMIQVVPASDPKPTGKKLITTYFKKKNGSEYQVYGKLTNELAK